MLLINLVRSLVLAVLFTLGSPAPGVSDSPQPQRVVAATPHTSQIRVASYNVCAEHCNWMRPWSWRATRIVQRIAATRPDVVVVVEAGGAASVGLLDRLMARHGLHRMTGKAGRFIYVRDGVDMLRTGLVLAQRTEGSKRVWTPWSEIRVGDSEPVTVVAIHLTATDSKALDRDRLHEARTVKHSLQGHERVVMIGDFNSLSRHHRAGRDADHDRWRVHKYLTDNGWTAATGGGTYIKQREQGDRRHLGALAFDRAYARGVEVKRFRLMPGGKRHSDHRGVVAVVQPRLPLSVTTVREDDPRGR